MKQVHYSDRKLLNEICKTLKTYTGIHGVYYNTENRSVRFKIYLDAIAFNKVISPLFYDGLTYIQFSENSDFDSELITNIILDEIADELIKNKVYLDYDEFDNKVGRLAGVPVSQYKNIEEEEEDSKGCVVTENKSPTASSKYLTSYPFPGPATNVRKLVYTNPAILSEYEIYDDLSDTENLVYVDTVDKWTIKTYYDN